MSVSVIRTAANYIEVLKPLPSVLLAFIGLCVAFIAGEGELSARLLLVVVTILLAAAGANGLMVEVHYDPAEAMVDGQQTITPDELEDIIDACQRIRQLIVPVRNKG